MLLQIGELAKRTGLTIRALRHYDSIGLLTPSARSDAGYRLYNQRDVARLYRIQALRKLGLSLADIGAYLERPDLPLSVVVARQIEALTRQIDEAGALRARLLLLNEQMASGGEPEPADLLTTLEHMSMYDKYFSPEELKQLPLYAGDGSLQAEWQTLVASVRSLMDAGVSPADERAQALSRQWMSMVRRDTASNPVLFAKLHAMHEQEPSVQQHTGITFEVRDYVLAAVSESKLAIYAKYLSEDELAYTRAHIGKRSTEWPPLIAKVRTAMDSGVAPESPEAQELARHWFDLFRSFAGDNPETHKKFRAALANEPGLTDGGNVNAEMRDFIRTAMMALHSPKARG